MIICLLTVLALNLFCLGPTFLPQLFLVLTLLGLLGV